MENKSLIKIDKVLKKVREKESFTIKNALEICKYPMYTIVDKFESPLKLSDQDKIANMEKANLWTIGTVFNAILLSDDPYVVVRMSERDKYELDKTFYKSSEANKAHINIFRKKMAMKYAYLDSFTKGKATFTGKIPKSGFFCVRQIIADEWIQTFIMVLETVLDHAFYFAIDESEYAMFPQLYITAYLLKYYPGDFDIEPNENQLAYLMSAIPKFFYNADVITKVEKIYNS